MIVPFTMTVRRQAKRLAQDGTIPRGTSVPVGRRQSNTG